MFRSLRVKPETGKLAPDPLALSLEGLSSSADHPISLHSVNQLADALRRRIYRNLIPHGLLGRFGIDPITWMGPDRQPAVKLEAGEDLRRVSIRAYALADPAEPFLELELEDNSFNSIDLNLIMLNDPEAPRYSTDTDEQGRSTFYGTVRRNLPEEIRAKEAGLAPAQIRAGLRGSGWVLNQVEGFLVSLGHRAFYLEPMTYASAWVFERRGFAYTRGHHLMDTIHAEFEPGGRLRAALDGSTPFRQPEQASTIRGRAWAIQDGVLAAIDQEWNELRMVKQLGRTASVDTAPGVAY